MPDSSTARAIFDHAGVSVASIERLRALLPRRARLRRASRTASSSPSTSSRAWCSSTPRARGSSCSSATVSEPTGPHHQIESTRRQGWFQFALRRTGHRRQTFACSGRRRREAFSGSDHRPRRRLAGRVRPRPRRQSGRVPATDWHPAGTAVTADVWELTRHGAVAVLTYRRAPENVLGFEELAELDALLVEPRPRPERLGHRADRRRQRLLRRPRRPGRRRSDEGGASTGSPRT